MRRGAAVVLAILVHAFGCAPRGASAAPPERGAGCSATVLTGGSARAGFREGDAPLDAIGITREGAVAATGSSDAVLASACAGAEIIDLRGAVAIPGLVDAHGHVLSHGLAMQRVDLRGATSPEEAAERAALAAMNLPADAWILGRGWDQNLWPTGALPDRAVLDERIADRPVVLTRIDGHAVWVNSAALLAAGIDRRTADPPGGAIVRRLDGEPTGVLVDNAMDLVTGRAPQPSADERRAAIELSLGRLAALGLTSVHDMGVAARDVEIYRTLDREGRLPLRVVIYLDGTQPLPESVAAAPEPGSPLVEVAGVKLFADGALGSRGALLLADYHDDPGNRGLAVTTVEDLVAAGRKAAVMGLAVAIHAIGDAGNRNALDAIERLAAEGLLAGRPRVEHAQVVAPADLPRFAALGAVASMQPVHAVSDMPWAERRLGLNRVSGAYAWRSLADAGAALAFGTDFPVEDADPRATVRAAVTRADAAGRPEGGWHAEQCLGPSETLEAMTAGAAYAAGPDAAASRGRLEPGMRADITVLDRDPVETPPSELQSLRVLMTLVDGRIAYRAASP